MKACYRWPYFAILLILSSWQGQCRPRVVMVERRILVPIVVHPQKHQRSSPSYQSYPNQRQQQREHFPLQQIRYTTPPPPTPPREETSSSYPPWLRSIIGKTVPGGQGILPFYGGAGPGQNFSTGVNKDGWDGSPQGAIEMMRRQNQREANSSISTDGQQQPREPSTAHATVTMDISKECLDSWRKFAALHAESVRRAKGIHSAAGTRDTHLHIEITTEYLEAWVEFMSKYEVCRNPSEYKADHTMLYRVRVTAKFVKTWEKFIVKEKRAMEKAGVAINRNPTGAGLDLTEEHVAAWEELEVVFEEFNNIEKQIISKMEEDTVATIPGISGLKIRDPDSLSHEKSQQGEKIDKDKESGQQDNGKLLGNIQALHQSLDPQQQTMPSPVNNPYIASDMVVMIVTEEYIKAWEDLFSVLNLVIDNARELTGNAESGIYSSFNIFLTPSHTNVWENFLIQRSVSLRLARGGQRGTRDPVSYTIKISETFIKTWERFVNLLHQSILDTGNNQYDQAGNRVVSLTAEMADLWEALVKGSGIFRSLEQQIRQQLENSFRSQNNVVLDASFNSNLGGFNPRMLRNRNGNNMFTTRGEEFALMQQQYLASRNAASNGISGYQSYELRRMADEYRRQNNLHNQQNTRILHQLSGMQHRPSMPPMIAPKMHVHHTVPFVIQDSGLQGPLNNKPINNNDRMRIDAPKSFHEEQFINEAEGSMGKYEELYPNTNPQQQTSGQARLPDQSLVVPAPKLHVHHVIPVNSFQSEPQAPIDHHEIQPQFTHEQEHIYEAESVEHHNELAQSHQELGDAKPVQLVQNAQPLPPLVPKFHVHHLFNVPPEQQQQRERQTAVNPNIVEEESIYGNEKFRHEGESHADTSIRPEQQVNAKQLPAVYLGGQPLPAPKIHVHHLIPVNPPGNRPNKVAVENRNQDQIVDVEEKIKEEVEIGMQQEGHVQGNKRAPPQQLPQQTPPIVSAPEIHVHYIVPVDEGMPPAKEPQFIHGEEKIHEKESIRIQHEHHMHSKARAQQQYTTPAVQFVDKWKPPTVIAPKFHIHHVIPLKGPNTIAPGPERNRESQTVEEETIEGAEAVRLQQEKYMQNKAKVQQSRPDAKVTLMVGVQPPVVPDPEIHVHHVVPIHTELPEPNRAIPESLEPVKEKTQFVQEEETIYGAESARTEKNTNIHKEAMAQQQHSPGTKVIHPPPAVPVLHVHHVVPLTDPQKPSNLGEREQNLRYVQEKETIRERESVRAQLENHMQTPSQPQEESMRIAEAMRMQEERHMHWKMRVQQEQKKGQPIPIERALQPVLDTSPEIHVHHLLPISPAPVTPEVQVGLGPNRNLLHPREKSQIIEEEHENGAEHGYYEEHRRKFRQNPNIQPTAIYRQRSNRQPVAKMQPQVPSEPLNYQQDVTHERGYEAESRSLEENYQNNIKSVQYPDAPVVPVLGLAAPTVPSPKLHVHHVIPVVASSSEQRQPQIDSFEEESMYGREKGHYQKTEFSSQKKKPNVPVNSQFIHEEEHVLEAEAARIQQSNPIQNKIRIQNRHKPIIQPIPLVHVNIPPPTVDVPELHIHQVVPVASPIAGPQGNVMNPEQHLNIPVRRRIEETHEEERVHQEEVIQIQNEKDVENKVRIQQQQANFPPSPLIHAAEPLQPETNPEIHIHHFVPVGPHKQPQVNPFLDPKLNGDKQHKFSHETEYIHEAEAIRIQQEKHIKHKIRANQQETNVQPIPVVNVPPVAPAPEIHVHHVMPVDPPRVEKQPVYNQNFQVSPTSLEKEQIDEAEAIRIQQEKHMEHKIRANQPETNVQPIPFVNVPPVASAPEIHVHHVMPVDPPRVEKQPVYNQNFQVSPTSLEKEQINEAEAIRIQQEKHMEHKIRANPPETNVQPIPFVNVPPVAPAPEIHVHHVMPVDPPRVEKQPVYNQNFQVSPTSLEKEQIDEAEAIRIQQEKHMEHKIRANPPETNVQPIPFVNVPPVAPAPEIHVHHVMPVDPPRVEKQPVYNQNFQVSPTSLEKEQIDEAEAIRIQQEKHMEHKIRANQKGTNVQPIPFVNVPPVAPAPEIHVHHVMPVDPPRVEKLPVYNQNFQVSPTSLEKEQIDEAEAIRIQQEKHMEHKIRANQPETNVQPIPFVNVPPVASAPEIHVHHVMPVDPPRVEKQPVYNQNFQVSPTSLEKEQIDEAEAIRIQQEKHMEHKIRANQPETNVQPIPFVNVPPVASAPEIHVHHVMPVDPPRVEKQPVYNQNFQVSPTSPEIEQIHEAVAMGLQRHMENTISYQQQHSGILESGLRHPLPPLAPKVHVHHIIPVNPSGPVRHDSEGPESTRNSVIYNTGLQGNSNTRHVKETEAIRIQQENHLQRKLSHQELKSTTNPPEMHLHHVVLVDPTTPEAVQPQTESSKIDKQRDVDLPSGSKYTKHNEFEAMRRIHEQHMQRKVRVQQQYQNDRHTSQMSTVQTQLVPESPQNTDKPTTAQHQTSEGLQLPAHLVADPVILSPQQLIARRPDQMHASDFDNPVFIHVQRKQAESEARKQHSLHLQHKSRLHRHQGITYDFASVIDPVISQQQQLEAGINSITPVDVLAPSVQAQREQVEAENVRIRQELHLENKAMALHQQQQGQLHGPNIPTGEHHILSSEGHLMFTIHGTEDYFKALQAFLETHVKSYAMAKKRRVDEGSSDLQILLDTDYVDMWQNFLSKRAESTKLVHDHPESTKLYAVQLSSDFFMLLEKFLKLHNDAVDNSTRDEIRSAENFLHMKLSQEYVDAWERFHGHFDQLESIITQLKTLEDMNSAQHAAPPQASGTQNPSQNQHLSHSELKSRTQNNRATYDQSSLHRVHKMRSANIQRASDVAGANDGDQPSRERARPDRPGAGESQNSRNSLPEGSEYLSMVPPEVLRSLEDRRSNLALAHDAFVLHHSSRKEQTDNLNASERARNSHEAGKLAHRLHKHSRHTNRSRRPIYQQSLQNGRGYPMVS